MLHISPAVIFWQTQYHLCSCVQATTSRVTGSLRGTVESGRAWRACCLAGNRTTSFPLRVPRLLSFNLHGLLRQVADDDFTFLDTHSLPCRVSSSCIFLWACFFYFFLWLQDIDIHVWNKHLALPPAASGSRGGSFPERLKRLAYSSSVENIDRDFMFFFL